MRFAKWLLLIKDRTEEENHRGQGNHLSWAARLICIITHPLITELWVYNWATCCTGSMFKVIQSTTMLFVFKTYLKYENIIYAKYSLKVEEGQGAFLCYIPYLLAFQTSFLRNSNIKSFFTHVTNLFYPHIGLIETPTASITTIPKPYKTITTKKRV